MSIHFNPKIALLILLTVPLSWLASIEVAEGGKPLDQTQDVLTLLVAAVTLVEKISKDDDDD